jgi:F0F1-type ATP synthase assembly protein I
LREARDHVKRSPSWLRHAGVGVELAAAVAGFTLIGYWIDRHFGSAPWGLIVGLALGLVGGMYNLVRESLAAAKEARAEDEENRAARGAQPGAPGGIDEP